MPINPALLIAAPMLQDYLVDKDSGFPLAGGIVSMFNDASRSFYKNWYYQTGVPGAYSWIPLDNPLSLSSVGTIQDPNGNDVIPFYYPFDENDENIHQPYYVTVYSVDQNGNPNVLQFTRENFPYINTNSNPADVTPTLRNYIVNNVYWRNIGSLNATAVTNQIIAPSQHDGYTNGDIRFLKSVAGATDTLTFSPVTPPFVTVPPNTEPTPEFMINMECTAVQDGEIQKCIQYPVSMHIETLANINATLTIWAQNVAGNTNNFLDLYVYQYLGSGALSQPAPILIQRIVLNNTMQKFEIPFIFPDNIGLTLGTGGDDALFIQVQYPLSALFDINHTKPSIYIGNDFPDNDFDTYDQIGAITDSPRTGDIRTSINQFYPFGWVPLNNGTIGNASSNATGRANKDTWPLFNLLWTLFSGYTNSTTNVLAQMVNSSGAAVAYGGTAIADFNANNSIALSQAMGKVLLGTVPAPAMTNVFNTTFTAASNILTAGNNVALFDGMPITFTGTTTLSTSTVYFVTGFDGTKSFFLSTTFAQAISGTPNVTVASDTGVMIAALNNSLEGEYSHTQLEAELATHSHPGSTIPYANTNNVAGSGGITLPKAPGNTAVNIAPDGSSTPFNVTQPGIFMNMYMKL